MNNGNLPIAGNPILQIDANGIHHVIGFENGLTKREYFAAIAMQGLLANSGLVTVTTMQKVYASDSVKCADALLLELEKEPIK